MDCTHGSSAQFSVQCLEKPHTLYSYIDGDNNGDDDNGDVLIAMVMMMTMTTVLGNDVDEGNGAALQ